jgi:hypothetical protein
LSKDVLFLTSPNPTLDPFRPLSDATLAAPHSLSANRRSAQAILLPFLLLSFPSLLQWLRLDGFLCGEAGSACGRTERVERGSCSYLVSEFFPRFGFSFAIVGCACRQCPSLRLACIERWAPAEQPDTSYATTRGVAIIMADGLSCDRRVRVEDEDEDVDRD